MALTDEAKRERSPYAVAVEGLIKRYGRVTALRGVNLHVSWGERLSLFGANGSGKTTLIKVLATLAKATEGEVRIAGEPLSRNTPGIRRLLGVVTHQTFLYHELTAYENLLFFGRMFGVRDPEARAHETSRMMGVENRLHHKVRTLSHGTQKRFSLARALLHNPPILLLDEPETGLDQGVLEAMDAILQDQTEGRTVIMTTHNLERGLALGSHIALLAGGRVIYQERREHLDAAELRSKYAQLAGAAQ